MKANKIFRTGLMLMIMTTQVLPTWSSAQTGALSQVDKGDVLVLKRTDRTARTNPNFSLNNRNNRAISGLPALPKDTRVAYTGKYKKLPSGHYGIEVELIDGIKDPRTGKEGAHKGKLVWIYYKKNERSIEITDENADESKRSEEKVTKYADILDEDESPAELFDKDHERPVDGHDLIGTLDQVQGLVHKVGSKANDPSCDSKLCNQTQTGHQDEKPKKTQNLNGDAALAQVLNEAVSSVAARERIMKAGIPTTPLLRALEFYNENKKDRNLSSKYLIVADLTQPSSRKRLYRINLQTGQVEHFTTSHGYGYGNSRECAHAFGNRSSSDVSSGGGYVTGTMRKFRGQNALNLHGVDEGSNDRAFSRGILFHRGAYVTDSGAGRSRGCLTVANKYAESFFASIVGHGRGTDGTGIYVYPDRDDLKNPNSYWDATCRSNLAHQHKSRRWIP